MTVRPIILKGPGSPRRKFPSQLPQPPQSLNGDFVTNASTPQLADYALVAGLGFFLASAVTPQGQANASEYHFGAHAQAIHQAESIKSSVQGSVRTPPAAAAASRLLWASPERIDLSIGGSIAKAAQGSQGRVPPAILAQQDNPWQIQPLVWKAAPAPTLIPPALKSFFAGPQPADLTQQPGLLNAPLFALQGRVPPIVAGASQADTTQIAAAVWKSLVAPPIVPNPTAAFFTVPPQTEERPTRQVWSSQVSGKTPRVAPPVWGAPQLYDFTQPARIIPPALAPTVVSYAFRSIYGAPQSIDLTQQGWIVDPTPSRQGRVPPTVFASQADPSQIAARIFPRAYPSATPGVFPPDSPLHFRAAPPTRRLGEATEALKTARLGEPTESPEAERLGSATTKPPGEGLGS